MIEYKILCFLWHGYELDELVTPLRRVICHYSNGYECCFFIFTEDDCALMILREPSIKTRLSIHDGIEWTDAPI